MATFRASYGPIKIIPASALRSPGSFFRQDVPSSSEPQPINAAFYAPMGGIYNPSFVPGYDGGAFDNYSMHYYGGPETTAYGGGYRGFPQPQPSPPIYRRSRTAPARTLPRTPAQPHQNYARYRTRGQSADPVDYRYYRSFSGPAKRPTPMYKKRRLPQGPGRQSNYQETEFIDRPSTYYYGATAGPYSIDQSAPYTQQPPAHTLRRVRPYYSPSYTTYPPSTMYPMGVAPYGVPPAAMTPNERKEAQRRYINKKYPLFARIALKFAQLILGAAILGLVLGPMKNYSFHDFVIRTQTEWQGAVVGIVAVFAILTLLLLVSVFLANSQHAWRKFDAYVSGCGAFLYILVAFLESYFAACYPPNGKNHPEVCHRAEWIIACILAYFNIITYLVDFILAMRTGISML